MGYQSKNWVRLFKNNINDFIRDEDLTASALRVFILCCSCMEEGYRGKVSVKQVEMAEALGLGRPTVSAAVKLLVSKGYLLRGGNRYFVNSRLATSAKDGDLPWIRARERELIASTIATQELLLDEEAEGEKERMCPKTKMS